MSADAGDYDIVHLLCRLAPACTRDSVAPSDDMKTIRTPMGVSAIPKDSHMFFLTYLRRELQRRMRQAILIAVGLAVGIGLVLTVTAASAGVANAQATVLHALYGIGTDITVTQAPPPGGGGAGVFGPGSTDQQVDELLNANLGVLSASSVTDIAHLHGVAAVAGGLKLTDMKLTVPSASSLGSGGLPSRLPTPTIINVNGVDLAHLGLGPFGSGQLSAGRTFAATDTTADVAVPDANYATANKLYTGATITIAKTTFTVIGIVKQSQGGGSADVYIPLERAQTLGLGPGKVSLKDHVNVIYVAAASASAVSTVQKEIEQLAPSATVTTSSSLASAVSGSLASASSLINNLGQWLAIAVLLAVFLVASLLTMAAVARRVREFGTLKALGWSNLRIISQVMAESFVVGVVGAVLGIGLGYGGALLVDHVAPTLSATVAQNPGSAPAQGSLLTGSGVQNSSLVGSTSSVIIHLNAQITLGAILLAVALALAGGLLAGALGSWRAARLRPAEALAQVA
jgi:putative ABC transport system permease protein